MSTSLVESPTVVFFFCPRHLASAAEVNNISGRGSGGFIIEVRVPNKLSPASM
jgi:hypothetical protein